MIKPSSIQHFDFNDYSLLDYVLDRKVDLPERRNFMVFRVGSLFIY